MVPWQEDGSRVCGFVFPGLTNFFLGIIDPSLTDPDEINPSVQMQIPRRHRVATGGRVLRESS